MNLTTLFLVGVKTAPVDSALLYYGDLIAAGLIILMLLIIKFSSFNTKNKNYA